MNPLHLLWIIPLSMWFGMVVMARFDDSDTKRDECHYCPFPCERNK